MKQKIMILLTLILCFCVLSVPAQAAELPFDDIEGHWGKESILWAYQEGFVSGVSNTKFAPSARITRAEFITLVYRMAEEPEITNAEPFFTDVPETAFYFQAVQWAEENNLMHGRGYGYREFLPNSFITREEIAMVLHQYVFYEYPIKYPGNPYFSIDYPDYPEQYTDTAEISESADRAMRWAVGLFKLLSGKTPTTLNPKDAATRAEAVTFIKRFRSE